MKKALLSVMLLVLVLGATGCRTQSGNNTVIIDGDDGPTAVFLKSKVSEDANKGFQDTSITDKQALSAIRNYCHANNPELEDIEKAGDYPVYWDVISDDENEIVVLYRSYTGAQIRYYIDPASGDTYVTEFVPGISSEEERTDEGFNVKDYLSVEDVPTGQKLSLDGTWETASMGYEYNGTMQPEYYVRFTDTEINYGHMKDENFALDHSERIVLFEETSEGGCRIQAETADGVQYTYQTSESDENVLEYYETWDEEDFSEMYRAGASLSRSDQF